MAQLTHGFDATQHEPQQSFDPIPAGKYIAMITESEVKQNKAQTGHYLNLTWEIIDGPRKGRKVWDLLNIDNPNQKAVEIAQRALAAICIAVDKPQITDSSEIHDIPVEISVKITPAKDNYEAKNQIKGYKALASKPVSGSAPVAAQAQPATSAHSAPPWQK